MNKIAVSHAKQRLLKLEKSLAAVRAAQSTEDAEEAWALQEPGETFSDVILRLADRGSYAAVMRGTLNSGPNA
jgi:hypothetical protein